MGALRAKVGELPKRRGELGRCMCNRFINAPPKSPNSHYLFVWLVDSCELCIMATDKEVILNTLQRERDELHEKILQVDRIIKKVKGLEYGLVDEQEEILKIDTKPTKHNVLPVNSFNNRADLKVQVLSVLDLIGKAAKMKDLQAEYHRISGNAYSIREAVRSLNRQRIILMMRQKDAMRGVLWVRKEWLLNGVLMDEYKPEGFDVFYQPSNLIYE